MFEMIDGAKAEGLFKDLVNWSPSYQQLADRMLLTGSIIIIWEYVINWLSLLNNPSAIASYIFLNIGNILAGYFLC